MSLSLALPIIGDIVKGGLKRLNEKQRTRFKDKFHDILTDIEKAKTRTGDDYTDSAIAFSEKEFVIFLTAYRDEVENANNNTTI